MSCIEYTVESLTHINFGCSDLIGPPVGVGQPKRLQMFLHHLASQRVGSDGLVHDVKLRLNNVTTTHHQTQLSDNYTLDRTLRQTSNTLTYVRLETFYKRKLG